MIDFILCKDCWRYSFDPKDTPWTKRQGDPLEDKVNLWGFLKSCTVCNKYTICIILSKKLFSSWYTKTPLSL